MTEAGCIDVAGAAGVRVAHVHPRADHNGTSSVPHLSGASQTCNPRRTKNFESS